MKIENSIGPRRGIQRHSGVYRKEGGRAGPETNGKSSIIEFAPKLIEHGTNNSISLELQKKVTVAKPMEFHSEVLTNCVNLASVVGLQHLLLK